MTGEGSHAGHHAQQRAAFDAIGAAARHEGANVGGRHVGETGEVRRLAEMIGHEGDELPDVAGVGLDCMRGHAPLAHEAGEPFEPDPGQIGRRAGKGERRISGLFG